MSSFEPIDIELLNRGSTGNSSWTLPTWGNQLSSRVLLLAIVRNGVVVPVGTGFSISRIGISFTATHVIDEAFPAFKTISRMGIDPQIRSAIGVAAATNKKSDDLFTVLSIPLSVGGPVKFAAIEMASVVEPTDIGVVSYGRIVPEQPQSVWDALPISPMLPKIGSTVYCVGYCDFDNSTKLTVEELFTYDRRTIENKLRASFRITKGEVTHVYTSKYSDSYGAGPCFRISCALRHGQSGGPVVNTDGYVCGINMSATIDSSDDSCLASLLSPALGGNLQLPENIATRYKIPRNVKLIDLIANGYINSDGSLKTSAFVKRDGQFSILSLEAIVKLYQRAGIELPSELKEFDNPDGVVSDFSDTEPQ